MNLQVVLRASTLWCGLWFFVWVTCTGEKEESMQGCKQQAERGISCVQVNFVFASLDFVLFDHRRKALQFHESSSSDAHGGWNWPAEWAEGTTKTGWHCHGIVQMYQRAWKVWLVWPENWQCVGDVRHLWIRTSCSWFANSVFVALCRNNSMVTTCSSPLNLWNLSDKLADCSVNATSINGVGTPVFSKQIRTLLPLKVNMLRVFDGVNCFCSDWVMYVQDRIQTILSQMKFFVQQKTLKSFSAVIMDMEFAGNKSPKRSWSCQVCLTQKSSYLANPCFVVDPLRYPFCTVSKDNKWP